MSDTFIYYQTIIRIAVIDEKRQCIKYTILIVYVCRFSKLGGLTILSALPLLFAIFFQVHQQFHQMQCINFLQTFNTNYCTKLCKNAIQADFIKFFSNCTVPVLLGKVFSLSKNNLEIMTGKLKTFLLINSIQ